MQNNYLNINCKYKEDCLNIVKNTIFFKIKVEVIILCDVENCELTINQDIDLIGNEEIARLIRLIQISYSRWINFPGFNWSNLWCGWIAVCLLFTWSQEVRGMKSGECLLAGQVRLSLQDQRDSVRFSDRWLNLLMERNCLSLSRCNIVFRSLFER